MVSRIVGRLQRIWCAVRGHVVRELGWPGLWASRHFSCRCGVAGSQYEGPRAVDDPESPMGGES